MVEARPGRQSRRRGGIVVATAVAASLAVTGCTAEQRRTPETSSSIVSKSFTSEPLASPSSFMRTDGVVDCTGPNPNRTEQRFQSPVEGQSVTLFLKATKPRPAVVIPDIPDSRINASDGEKLLLPASSGSILVVEKDLTVSGLSSKDGQKQRIYVFCSTDRTVEDDLKREKEGLKNKYGMSFTSTKVNPDGQVVKG